MKFSMKNRKASATTMGSFLFVCVVFLCAATAALAQAGRGSITAWSPTQPEPSFQAPRSPYSTTQRGLRCIRYNHSGPLQLLCRLIPASMK